MPTYKGYLRDLVFAAGGDLMEENSKMLKSRGYVVYSVDPPLEVDSADTQDVMDRRLLEANELAARIGAQLVPHTWILDSIAACKIQSISSDSLFLSLIVSIYFVPSLSRFGSIDHPPRSVQYLSLCISLYIYFISSMCCSDTVDLYDFGAGSLELRYL